MTVTRCLRCGAEMVPYCIDRYTVIWFCLECDEIRLDLGDLWARAVNGGEVRRGDVD